MNIFNSNDPKLRGDITDDRLNFANDYRRKLLEQAKRRIEHDKRREQRFLQTGNFYYKTKQNPNIPQIRMNPTSLQNVDYNKRADLSRLLVEGSGRYNNSIFKNALKKREANFKELELAK